MAIIDFMAEARKIEARQKKFNLKTFGDAVDDIWKTCCRMGNHAKRIDVVFDCYVRTLSKVYKDNVDLLQQILFE